MELHHSATIIMIEVRPLFNYETLAVIIQHAGSTGEGLRATSKITEIL